MLAVFRTDSTFLIGTGHLMRCLTLARELAMRGYRICFVCRGLDGNAGSVVESRGYKLFRLTTPENVSAATDCTDSGLAHAAWLGVSQELDSTQTAQILEGFDQPVDWLIIDHYALDTRWESRVRSQCLNLMVVDDLADRAHVCDLLLDQNLFQDMDYRYRALVPASCAVLLGPDYALLRPEFQRVRETAQTRSGKIRHLFIFFGGVDAQNVTLTALQAMLLVDDPDLTADVVIGQACPHRDSLLSYCAHHHGVRFHVQTDRVGELMAAADLAIGGGGVATWERCSVGLPALVISLAYNQVAISEAVAQVGAIRYLGNQGSVTSERIADEVQRLRSEPNTLARMSDRSKALVDARGALVVADAMEGVR